jgi:putative YhdH/YhfP family quinone oxidoreductase
MSDSFRCYYVEKDAAGRVHGRVQSLPVSDLPPGEVLIRVAYSSLNYKDALAATGHPGVARNLPHVPGIDAAGTVVQSDTRAYRQGDEVIVTGYELGAGHWGGWSELIRVPADWIVARPAGLTPLEAMSYGTAGFTAAQALAAIEHQGITPNSGEVVVTGASGGVGCLAVGLLAKAGFRAVASSGKPQAAEMFRQLGASRIVSRDEVRDISDRPLLSARWAAAVDNVGGQTLATLLKSLDHGGLVAACGLVGGHELAATVYPFLLRGIHLAGIASAGCPMPQRREIWRKLATEWKLPQLASVVTVITLEQLPKKIAAMLAGNSLGRVVVEIDRKSEMGNRK